MKINSYLNQLLKQIPDMQLRNKIVDFLKEDVAKKIDALNMTRSNNQLKKL
jgi:hypothetical protein